jgi:hypothetical protein
VGIAEPAPNYAPAARVYAAGPAAPAAVLVLWPDDDTLARDPASWTAQGFDVVMPQPADIYRLVADQGVSGVVMTSVAWGARSCSESFFYSDSGTGTPPKVEVSRSGDCGMDTPAITGRQPSVLPASPAPRPNQPRLIEASAVGRNLPPAAKARHLAELIKSAPLGKTDAPNSNRRDRPVAGQAGSRSRPERAAADSHSPGRKRPEEAVAAVS